MICFRSPEALTARLDEYATRYDIPRSLLVRHAVVALISQLDKTQPYLVIPPGFEVKIQVTPKERKVRSEIPEKNSPIWNEDTDSEKYGKDNPPQS